MSGQITFRTMLKDRHFQQIFAAGVISRFGDAVDTIAYSFMVYEMTGSAVLMAALFAVNGIPSLIFSMISGVVVSYMPKKSVVYICDFLRGSVVVLTGILYFTGDLEVWHLYAFTLLNSTFEAFRVPASGVLFVQLIHRDKLEHATSLNNSVRTFAELIGYGAATAIIGLVGVSGAIIVDGITFFIAGIIIMTIVRDKEVLSKEKLTLKRYFTELKEGFTYVRNNPLVRSLTFFLGGLMLMFAPFNALQNPYVLENMALGVEGITVLSVSFMVSMILGSLVVPALSKKIGGRRLFIFGGITTGFGYMSFGFIEVFSGTQAGYVALAVVSMLMGSTISFMNVPLSVTLMKKVDKNLMARVMALINVFSLAAIPIGGGAVGALVNYVEIPTLFFVTSLGVILLFVSQIFNASLKELDASVGTGIGNDPSVKTV